MTGRLWAVFAALLASSVGLAGCIEAFDQYDPDAAGITAMEDRDLAANAAAAWHPEAFPVGAASVETADVRAGVPLDAAAGDGRAPFWYYAYGAPGTEENRLFRVTQDGQVTAEEDLPVMLRGLDFENVALTDWSVDSDAAVAAVAATESVAGVFGAGNLSVIAGVGATPDTPSWLVTAFSDVGFAVALVDARTGEVEVRDVEMADVPQFAGSVPMPPFAALLPEVRIQDEGTLDDETPSKEYAFEAGEGMRGRFEVWAQSVYPHERLEFWIVDEDGDERLIDGRVSDTSPDERRAYEFDVERRGAYTLVVRLDTPLDWMPGAPALGEVDFGFDLLVSYAIPDMPETPETAE